MPDKHVEAPAPGYGWIAAALALLLLMVSVMIGLYLTGFYEQHHDRVWASILLLVITMLGCTLAYWWHGLPLKPTDAPVNGRLTKIDNKTASLSTSLQNWDAYSWHRETAWVAVLNNTQAEDDTRATQPAWAETEHALFVNLGPDYPQQKLRSLRGRWRLPLDGVVLLEPALPALGSAALQRLQDFNSRSGWRLPVCLALTGWTAPTDGVSCTLSDASSAESTTCDLQRLAWQLAVKGQAEMLREQPDSKRLALSAALDQPGIITQLAQQLVKISQHLPAGQQLVRLSWVAEGETALPDHLAQQIRSYPPRRHRLSAMDKLGWGFTALALLLMLGLTISFLQNHQLIQQADQQMLALRQARSPNSALPALSAVQQQIGRLEQQRQHLPWWWRLGLNQTQVVQQALLDVYGKAARHWVVKPVQQNLRQVLLALNDLPLSNGENAAMHLAQQQGYDSLKAYLMLDMPTRTQPAFLAAQLQQADGLSGGTRAELLRFYSSQLPKQPGWRLPAEPDVVAAARQTLLSLNGIEHGEQTIYQSILAQAAAKYPPRSAASLLPGVDSRGMFAIPGTLPGVYTREAWEGYVSTAFDKADPKQGSEAAWVMAVAGNKGDAAALQNRLRQRYFADYAAAWQIFLNHLHWQTANSLASAAEQLNAYADPQRSPLQALMTMLQYQGRAGAAEKSLASNLLDKTRQLVGKAASNEQQTDAGPLTAAFGPLLALSVPPDGNNAGNTRSTSSVSLARYLETITAVRLKLQQLSASPNPDAAARQLAQLLFKGQQNELSDGQKYAALLAASLGQEWAGFAQQLFVSPLDGAGMVVMLPAAADVNALWRRSIVLPWGREMAGRFPFNATDNDASIPGLSRYLAPEQGEIARFLGNTLGGALVQEGDQWLPSPSLANAAAFDADFLNAVNTLSRLASRWYVQGEAAYQFELMPVAMPGLVRTELSVDGQTLSYFNQKESWSALRWPGNSQQAGSRLVWESLKSGARQTLEFSGRWAFIRLLEKARVEQLDKARYQLDFALPDGLSARYILRTSAADGPLALLKLLQFKLPERVFVLPGPVANGRQAMAAD